MQTMTDDIRKAVKIELARRGWTQERLADEVNRSRQQINNALRGRASKTPDLWEDIFKAFNWRVIVVDEQGNEVK